MNRRQLLGAASFGIVSFALGAPAFAEWTPRRPLNIIVPYAPGGGTDTYARAVVAASEGIIPVPVVIVNRPGASGISGAIEAAGARPDGNTIMMHSTGSFLLRHMHQETEVGPFNSFQTIAQIGELLGALVVPADSPIQSVEELVQAAESSNGSMRWSHNGRGAVYHVAGQTFLNSQGIEAVDVPFSGGAASRTAILSGEVDFGMIGLQQTSGFEDQMRVLAVLSDERDTIRDDVPTFAELGFDVPTISSPIVLFAPKGVDQAVVAGIEGAMNEITKTAEYEELLRGQGVAPLYRSGAEAEQRLRNMQEAAEPVIKAMQSSSE